MSNPNAILNRTRSTQGMQPHASAQHADTPSVESPTKKLRRCLAPIVGLILGTLASGAMNQSNAQAKYTATRAGDLQVGGGYTIGLPDYSQNKFKGGMFYTTFDFKEHYGIELNFHQIKEGGESKLYERTYEVGGRYVRHYGIYHPYAKLIYGRGVFNYEYDVANLAYNLGAVGAGVDINVHPRINVRVDYEYQRWFNFLGYVSQGNTTENNSTLSPQLFTIGAAYHFH